MVNKNRIESFFADEKDTGFRIDMVLINHYSDKSRNFFQKLLDCGKVSLNNKSAKSSNIVKAGDKIVIQFSAPEELGLKPLNIPLKIVFENDDLLIIDKPAGLVVHPGEGSTHKGDSLVNALLYHLKGRLSSINGVIRPGIVHRLDKDTSGLLIIAKNDKSHNYLSGLFKEGQVDKEYYALLCGQIETKSGLIEAPIGRDTKDRKKMAVVSQKGKMARTHFFVEEYYDDFSLVRVKLLTGRTHQIRVHFAEIGYPLAGDRLYGNDKINSRLDRDFSLKRQFLHAYKLSFLLPGAKKKREFVSKLPADLKAVLDGLKR